MRTKPLILSTAMTGVRFDPWKKDAKGNKRYVSQTKLAENMPVSLAEMKLNAVASYEEGARFIHVHARNPKTGAQFADLNYYKQVTHIIRHSCPALSSAIQPAVKERWKSKLKRR